VYVNVVLVSEREKPDSKEQHLAKAGQCIRYISALACRSDFFR